MSYTITIDRAGCIVLPIEVRGRLNLAPGSRLKLDFVAQRIELTPQPQADAELLVKAGGRKVLRATGRTFNATAATPAERDSQAKRGGRS